MPDHFADRLLDAIKNKANAPVCVGIDPDFEKLPAELKSSDPPAAIEAFSRAIIEAVMPVVPAVKPQIAYFERYGSAGLAVYERVVAAARQAGLLVIADIKRSDIGSTAAQYAAYHLGQENSPDAVTVSGYLGDDGLKPFVDAAAKNGRGVFVLVRTSNPSAGQVQDFADKDGRKLFEHVANQVAALGGRAGLVGQTGYSCVGAVVGATYPQEAYKLREIMPQQVFLVPGYGAQGGTADDCLACFKPNGTGAIVNASRSVIYAFADKKYAGRDWRAAIAEAAKAFAADIREAVQDNC